MYGKSRRPVGPAPGTQEQIQSFRKDRPYGPEGIHRILRQATGGTSEREHALPDFLWNLLEKLFSQRDGIHSEYGALLRYTQDYQKRLSIIGKELV